ncbi:hypothetical protein K503DRAFT_770130 [Rhizopogon vinicolor AM-OR11-026]|uniref:DUF6699 domain-containing protein n=1 Tax=Rhizopogon vinicolor AM-OR11-026 TaxID=1314800 RepID=A0A1B7N1S2_9AGAM|nr:hypothetical protein K503DRAFT_770130 [Rhizopogon vinicolor AM-OR11-026]
MSSPFVYQPATYEPPPYYVHPYTPQRSPFIPPSNLFPSSPYHSPNLPYVDLPETRTSYYPEGFHRQRRPSWHAGMAAAPPSPSFLGVPLPSGHNRRHSFGHSSRPAWPYNSSSQQCQIHPLLNGEAYGTELYFDIANPAFAPLRRAGPNNMVMLSVEELREHATAPTITSMRITHDAIPQWPIDLEFVHGEYDAMNPLPLTVGDILWMIHSSLHRQISHPDWARLSQSEETAIARAYTRRYRSSPSSAQMEASQGVKRVDYLMDRHVFRGLVRAADGDGFYHWRLLT